MLQSMDWRAHIIASERQYSIQSFGKSLLCVCDYLSMAVSSVAKEKVEGEAADKVDLERIIHE